MILIVLRGMLIGLSMAGLVVLAREIAEPPQKPLPFVAERQPDRYRGPEYVVRGDTVYQLVPYARIDKKGDVIRLRDGKRVGTAGSRQ